MKLVMMKEEKSIRLCLTLDSRKKEEVTIKLLIHHKQQQTEVSSLWLRGSSLPSFLTQIERLIDDDSFLTPLPSFACIFLCVKSHAQYGFNSVELLTGFEIKAGTFYA